MIEGFSAFLDRYRIQIDFWLLKYLSSFEGCPAVLKDAMGYSLQAKGKRLRPILLLMTFQAGGGADLSRALPFACALEMIHTYSLIHDDLPSMDDDDMRRGQPTSHRVFGEGMAVLAGDALLNGAFEVMLAHAEDKACLDAARVIAEAAGCRGMIGGQVHDLEGPRNLEELEITYQLKTGKLILAAVKAGACLSGADLKIQEALEKYACHLGMAFQIRDDILDDTGNAMQTGKGIGRDKKKGKITFSSFCEIREAEQRQAWHTLKAGETLASLPDSYRILDELGKHLASRVG